MDSINPNCNKARVAEVSQSIENLPLVAKFENFYDRVYSEPLLRSAFLALSYGSGTYTVLDHILKQSARIADDNEQLRNKIKLLEAERV